MDVRDKGIVENLLTSRRRVEYRSISKRQNEKASRPRRLWQVMSAMLIVSGFSPAAHAEELVNNLHFPGHYYDEESGLYYNWNRYYNPKTGRYITSDPIGLDGGLNLYEYANSNSVKNLDPEGLESESIDVSGKNDLHGDIGELIGDGICRAFNELWQTRFDKEIRKINRFRNRLGECVKGCWQLCVEITRHQTRKCVSDVYSSVGTCPRKGLLVEPNNFKTYKCIDGAYYGHGISTCCPPSKLPPLF